MGIIGRTGSGKSTMFQSLFGFLEIEAGDILIDVVSLKEVQLEVRRFALAVVPQDSVCSWEACVRILIDTLKPLMKKFCIA